jgi:hypothetical protein
MSRLQANFQTVPLSPKPAQTLSVVLGGQNCDITVYQKTTGLFFDLAIAGVYLVRARLCRDYVSLIRQPYLGFYGEMFFLDTQGDADPEYSGLGDRFQLVYTYLTA